ncbi:SEL1-like repeat protein [Bradyrhizobium sp. U87765 SZCCT0131]|uniref:tetratricopeptide repeat protein n=1 Tax=unclassified Bradyrhizobium TaxID=2631580 RepID=UPI001BAADAA2|nr:MULTISPECIES: SEL1-like repeat protein [unclassified Bradyrhizobium]MBR1221009.1 SEL1-like repeat protein [Bradyrhizobium sp. U87765 SZCCT0131]MBR1260171.1 SEL1-like repeat protein [Bradyrhizobium sp. U87765 SZCCT0134]MBR1307580.1 SEL1-like repeat protein [Bradyrhizobium sp. U87765 SZCCT0110]MBR1321534.1 SEL1-like repeat protein [Bradyrhizobium sp. U87765 SZCCT0109]MBR1349847.1 SEL1-like repeat protein [Bradyrhizobium sp. U87765 SZCCT0048]
MTSRVPRSVEATDPATQDRAEAAARRAGMSLNDWLATTGGTQPPAARSAAADVAEIHHRLDSITRQIERISQVASTAPQTEGPGVARELNDAIARLDARIAQINTPPAPPPVQPAPPLQAAQQPEPPHRPAAAPQAEAAPAPRRQATTIPELLDFDIAEIRARQAELNSEAPPSRLSASAAATMAPPSPPPAQPAAPAAAAPDMSAFEKQLQHLTSQIESLRRPDGVEQSIAAFRNELAEMRAVITDALPRRALEALENEIRAVARRIDEGHQNGIDAKALQSIEQGLRDIHTTLQKLTPAEQLAGFDEAIRNLGDKMDILVRTNPDSGSVQQLEGAIGALRAIVSNVASNDALARLSDDVRGLASRMDQVSHEQAAHAGFAGSLAALEQRIAVLTTTLEKRERPADDCSQLEAAVRLLSDRIDHLQVGHDTSSAFTHVEQRIQQLLERLETVDSRTANFGRVESGLADILRHLEDQRLSFAALSETRAGPSAMDNEAFGTIRREIADLRHSQSETDRNTQDALESVHNTLGHVVDRLAMIETDLRESRTARPAGQDVHDRAGERPRDRAPERPSPPMFAEPAPLARESAPPLAPIISSTAISAPMPAPSRLAVTPPPRPDLPNPVAAQTSAHRPPPPPPGPAPQAIQEILTAAAHPERAPAPPAPQPAAQNLTAQNFAAQNFAAQAARPIDPDLPPDYPLEPGTRPQERTAPPVTPSQRIAASESVLSEIPNAAKEAASTSSFIAAARRAAQAAANTAKDKPKDKGKDKPGRVAALANAARGAKADKAKAEARTAVRNETKGETRASSRIRSLLVGASVVVIVLSGFRMAMNMFDGGGHDTPPAAAVDKPADKPMEKSSEAAPPVLFDPGRAQQQGELTLPSMTSPTPIDRQARSVPTAPAAAPAGSNAATAPGDDKAASPDVTGSITVPPAAPVPATPYKPITLNPVTDALPDAIGGAVLRSAALKGDPAAAYEVAVRYAEGKGVAVNYEEAVKWYDRAADAGIVPAMFRLGTLYEKGLGLPKDVDAARRYYIRAAERSNAKAMHNLAVLDADGGSKGPNYKSAAQWFRKAADYGVADSQYNLGILYARGIGVEQNLAESYKWFSLAASQGDADSSRKRDDVARRLDPQSLAAAKLALQTFNPEVQPSDAISVPAPVGGWDAAATPAPAPTAAKRYPGKPAAKLTTAAR